MGDDNNESNVFSVGSIGGRNNKTKYKESRQVKPPKKIGKPSQEGEIDNNHGIAVQSQPWQQLNYNNNNTDQIQPPKQGSFPRGPGAFSYAYSYTPYTPYGYQQYPPPPYYGGYPPQMASGGYYGGYHPGQGYPGAFAPHHGGGYGMNHNNYGGAHMNMGLPAGAAATGAPVYGHGQQQQDTIKYAHDHNHDGAHTNMGLPAGAAAATATVYGQGQQDTVKHAHAHGELKHDGQGAIISVRQ